MYILYFLFQFERDKKSKGNETSHSIAHTIGLEEVLSSLSSSEFHDDQVITWCVHKKIYTQVIFSIVKSTLQK